MRVFVAGATGLIGRRTIELLLASDEEHVVCGVARDEESAKPLQDAGAGIAIADAFDGEMMRGVFATAQPEVIVNQLTELPSRIDPGRATSQFADNDRIRIEGTRNLIIGARTWGSHRIVTQSIAFAYAAEGDWIKDEDAPLDLGAPPPWGSTVAAVANMERQVMEARGMDGVVLRYGTLYGPGTWYDPEGGQIAEAVRAGNVPLIGDGRGRGSFIHVEDAARAAVAALDGPPGIYNIVDDDPVEMREWLPLYARSLGAPPPEEISVEEGLRRGDWVAVHRMTEQRAASNARARESLGWEPEHPSWREELEGAGSG
jgi:nucleoside-diphosphate-sugar epimerase